MISLEEISLRFGDRVIFDGVSANIESRDRIGLVGANGSGKSTLMKILTGRVRPGSGKTVKAAYVTVGYLPQDALTTAGRSLYREAESAFIDIVDLRSHVESAQGQLSTLAPESPSYEETLYLIGEWEERLEHLDAYRLQSRIETVLLGLGFSLDDMQRDTAEFSGGWQMRIALAKLLLSEPALLLLDEPTNHLDLDSLRWLENYLGNFRGALLIASHDRVFLDSLCTRTLYLFDGKLENYAGNYSFFEVEHGERSEQRARARKNQERQAAKTERFIERFRYKNTKARQVQSRVKSLARMQRIEVVPDEQEIQIRFSPPPRSGRSVIRLDGVHKAYGGVIVFRELHLEIERGDRVAVIGVNGAGKSTLTRILAGAEKVSSGRRSVGHSVSVAYFGQDRADQLHPDRTALETLAQGNPFDERSNLRDILGAFLFHGDDVFKTVGVLSGGERSRLALASLLLQPANCIILDEPTNHLDMNSKRVLQSALRNYPATFVIVSHDRAFLDPLVNRVLEVRKDGIRNFPGNVSEFITASEERAARQGPQSEKSKGRTRLTVTHRNARERRKNAAAQRAKSTSLRNRSKKIEARIEDFEARVGEFESAMADKDFFKQGEAQVQLRAYEALKGRLERAYDQWEENAAELKALTGR